jgi:uncharacterized protein
MQVDPEMKTILACPQCQVGELDWQETRNEVHCPRCKLIYPIVDGMPVMLIEEAKPFPESG